MVSGWNLWVWLVSDVVRRYIIDILIIIITFPYSTCISSFLAASSLFLCSFLNVFSFFYNYLFCNYSFVRKTVFSMNFVIALIYQCSMSIS